jgi:hypothetical protein
MTERSAACDEIVQSLMLFYLFERLSAGFMTWVSESGHDSEYMKKRKKDMSDQAPKIEASQKMSPFDTGFVPNDLKAYLTEKVRQEYEYLASKREKRSNIMPVYRDLDALMHSRNKVMHGQSAPETTEKTVQRIVGVMHWIAQNLGDQLGRLTKPNVIQNPVDHTSWARLLFLTEEELLWVARGQQLPINSSGNALLKLSFGRKEVDQASFRMTDRHRRTNSKKNPLYLSQELADCRNVWVSTTSFKKDRIEDIKPRLRNTARAVLDPESPLARFAISVISEGMEDVESDSFSIPWWKKAPDGEHYICIAFR